MSRNSDMFFANFTVPKMGPEVVLAAIRSFGVNLRTPIDNKTSVSYYCYIHIFRRYLTFCNVIWVFLKFEIVPEVAFADCLSLGVNLRVPVDRARSVPY